MNKKTIWAVVFIVGMYVTAGLIADIGATRFVEINSVVMPGGVFIFAVSFTLRDMVHKRLGKEWARAAISAGVVLSAIIAIYFWAIGQIDTPAFYQFGEEWTAIFALVPSIVVGSMIAEFVSQWINTEVYHWWWQRFGHLPQWTRALSSSAVSLPIDSLVFSLFAFVLLPMVFGGSSLSFFDALVRVASGQTLYKLIVVVISIPLIYTVKEKPLVDGDLIS